MPKTPGIPDYGYVPQPVYVCYCTIYNALCEVIPPLCASCRQLATGAELAKVEQRLAGKGVWNRGQETCPGYAPLTLAQLAYRVIHNGKP